MINISKGLIGMAGGCRERARFRARKSYLVRKKGLLPDLAHEQACKEFQFSSSSKSENTPKSLAKKYKYISQPSPQEIAKVVTEIKAADLRESRPTLVGSATIDFPKKFDPPKIKKPTKGALLPNLPIVALSVGIAAITGLLITASLESLGFTLEGVVKACLLEAGILYLSLSHTFSFLEWCFKRLFAAALICLSFFILHVGVEEVAIKSTNLALANNKSLELLSGRHKRLSEQYNALPTNYVTKRNELEASLTDIENEMNIVMEKAEDSPATEAIANSSLAENGLRAVLMCLNLFFAHELLRRFSFRRGGLSHV